MPTFKIQEVTFLYDAMKDGNDYRISYRYFDKDGKYSDNVLRIFIPVADFYKSAYSPEEVLFERIQKYSVGLAKSFFEWTAENKVYEESYKPLGMIQKQMQVSFKIPPGEIKKLYFGGDLMYDKGGLLGENPAAEVANAKPAYVSNGPDPAVATLPGLYETVKHPSGDTTDNCLDESTLRDMIMHLNDRHRWTREAIADWLETLDLDLRFKSPEDRLREQREKDIATLTDAMDSLTESILKWTKSIEDAKKQFDILNEKVQELQQEDNDEQG